MATGRFDTLTRSFVLRRSPRTRDRTDDATPAPDRIDPSFLLVQTASSGTFAANPAAGTPVPEGTRIPGGDADYLLTLSGHTGATAYFSDRPERVFGEAPTHAFLDGLGFPADNPPNAAIVTHDEDGTEDVLVVELLSPLIDSTSGALTYGVRILSDYEGDGLTPLLSSQRDEMLLSSFGAATLFIDDCPDETVACVFPASSTGEQNTCYAAGSNITIGTCWNWNDVWCDPCLGSADAYSDACTAAYPECVGECVAVFNAKC